MAKPEVGVANSVVLSSRQRVPLSIIFDSNMFDFYPYHNAEGFWFLLFEFKLLFDWLQFAPPSISRHLVELRIVECGGAESQHQTLFAGALQPHVKCVSGRHGRRQMCRVPFQDALSLKDHFDTLLVSVVEFVGFVALMVPNSLLSERVLLKSSN